MNSFVIRAPKMNEILESIKTFLLAFGRMDFTNILAEQKVWIYLINKGIAKFLIAEKDDKIIGVGGVFIFQQVASVGYMGVLAKYRGQGIGTAIFSSLMDITISKGIKTVMLYASKLGEPIYEKYGFRGKYRASNYHMLKPINELLNVTKNVSIVKYTPNWVLNLDRETIGFDRADYLNARITLGAKLLIIENEGYALLSNVLSKLRLGPLIAKNLSTALQIIKKGINLGAENLIIPNHPSLQKKISSITELTQNKENPNRKMVFGEEFLENLDYLYSIGTYAKG